MKIEANELEFVIFGLISEALRGEIDHDKTLTMIFVYTAMNFFNRSGLAKVHMEDLELCLDEIQKSCKGRGEPEHLITLNKILKKHVERIYEKEVYGKAIQ